IVRQVARGRSEATQSRAPAMNKDAAKLREISEHRGLASAEATRRATFGSRAATPMEEVRLTLPFRVADPSGGVSAYCPKLPRIPPFETGCMAGDPRSSSKMDGGNGGRTKRFQGSFMTSVPLLDVG